MICKFANNQQVEYIDAIETEEFYAGASRRTLTFYCPSDAISIDILNSILSNEENCMTITLTNPDEGITNIYEYYVLKLKVGIESVLVEPATPDRPAVYEDELVFKLGRRTYIEQSLHDLGIN